MHLIDLIQPEFVVNTSFIGVGNNLEFDSVANTTLVFLYSDDI
jgi:hypothetical protein